MEKQQILDVYKRQLIVRKPFLRASKIMQERVMNHEKIEVLFEHNACLLYTSPHINIPYFATAVFTHILGQEERSRISLLTGNKLRDFLYFCLLYTSRCV